MQNQFSTRVNNSILWSADRRRVLSCCAAWLLCQASPSSHSPASHNGVRRDRCVCCVCVARAHFHCILRKTRTKWIMYLTGNNKECNAHKKSEFDEMEPIMKPQNSPCIHIRFAEFWILYGENRKEKKKRKRELSEWPPQDHDDDDDDDHGPILLKSFLLFSRKGMSRAKMQFRFTIEFTHIYWRVHVHPMRSNRSGRPITSYREHAIRTKYP